MLYIVLAVIFLHLTVIPITVSIGVFADTDKEIGKISVRVFFVPVFVKKLDLSLISSILRGDSTEISDIGKPSEARDNETKKKSNKKKTPDLGDPFVKYLIRFGLELAKRIRVRRLDFDAVIGIGDAAATAVAVGTVSSAYGQTVAVLDCADKSSGEIKPDYDAERIYIDFNGIISLCFADIIYTALKAVKIKKKDKIVYARYISDRA